MGEPAVEDMDAIASVVRSVADMADLVLDAMTARFEADETVTPTALAVFAVAVAV